MLRFNCVKSPFIINPSIKFGRQQPTDVDDADDTDDADDAGDTLIPMSILMMLVTYYYYNH